MRNRAPTQLNRNHRPRGSRPSTICGNEMFAGSLVDRGERVRAATLRRGGGTYEFAERPGLAGGTSAAGAPGSAADEPGADRRDSSVRCGDCRARHFQPNDPYEFHSGWAEDAGFSGSDYRERFSEWGRGMGLWRDAVVRTRFVYASVQLLFDEPWRDDQWVQDSRIVRAAACARAQVLLWAQF